MLSISVLLFGISGGEILVVLLAVLLLFGPKKIPEIARLLGRGINEIRKVQREINTEIHRYSSDIEQEARKVQDSIDEMKKTISEPLEMTSSKTSEKQGPDEEDDFFLDNSIARNAD